jgi:hypothetical protein
MALLEANFKLLWMDYHCCIMTLYIEIVLEVVWQPCSCLIRQLQGCHTTSNTISSLCLLIQFFVSVIVLRIVTVAKIYSTDLSIPYTEYVNLYSTGYLASVEFDILSIAMLMCWLRALKLLQVPQETGPAAISILEVRDHSLEIVER